MSEGGSEIRNIAFDPGGIGLNPETTGKLTNLLLTRLRRQFTFCAYSLNINEAVGAGGGGRRRVVAFVVFQRSGDIFKPRTRDVRRVNNKITGVSRVDRSPRGASAAACACTQTNGRRTEQSDTNGSAVTKKEFVRSVYGSGKKTRRFCGK
ncbi:hypothetical protein EVAR_56241_1 [Eumeta japonica]|uniref:Uncharacterized protein n=1 Tax=Eumeta variegata TaxID=151549 RepID=A0A4C1XHS7_EUMVA|nr:hypothetical protein EVAR_56241_1 [Eumeta japonica]